MAKNNPITMLKEDHAKVKALLETLAETTERAAKKRVSLLAQISQEIAIHMKLEEEIFYPAFKAASEARDDQKQYYEAVEEHHAADVVLADLSKADPATLSFAGKAKVLKELILHHAQEEEKEMFPRARKLFDKAELEQLGDRMAARKKELLNSARPRRATSAQQTAQA